MPNLPTHIHLSEISYNSITENSLKTYLPEYLLGSTSPDIRVITKKNRSVYHFVDLDFKQIGDGFNNLKQQHPEWSNGRNSDDMSLSFMCGYLSHLVLDETWITTIYRKYFKTNYFSEDPVTRLVYDRALQLHLDNIYWDSTLRNLDLIKNSRTDFKVSFLANEPVRKWRDWISDLLGKGFSWKRLEFMASRISKGDPSHSALSIAKDILDAPDKNIMNILNKLPSNTIDEFEKTSLANIERVLQDFLKCGK
jgi:hypothetical protein